MYAGTKLSEAIIEMDKKSGKNSIFDMIATLRRMYGKRKDASDKKEFMMQFAAGEVEAYVNCPDHTELEEYFSNFRMGGCTDARR